MPGYKRIPMETKQEVLQKVKDGGAVVDIAKQYGIYHKTVYRWISEQTDINGHPLEISRLKREKEELIRIIGILTVEVRRMKKN